MGKYTHQMGRGQLSTAFLCPGQASQKVGMGHDLYLNTDLGKLYFEEANDIMDMNIRDVIFYGPEEDLKQTRYTQPAIYIVSVIIGKLLQERGISPSCAAGHSLGEYSALALAEAYDFGTGLKLVKARAEGMQQAGKSAPGTMAAVIGLNDETVQNVCSAYEKGIVVAANFNAPNQVVISGDTAAVNEVMVIAKETGAIKAVELNVSGAFHSPLMAPAREVLAEELNSIEIQDCKIPVYTNVDAQPVKKSGDVKTRLIRQLENPVHWHATISAMINDGVTGAVEIGPGRVLQGLSKRINRSFNMSGVETLEQVENNSHV